MRRHRDAGHAALGIGDVTGRGPRNIALGADLLGERRGRLRINDGRKP